METLQELIYVLAFVFCSMAIGFAIFCHNHYRENHPKVKKIKKIQVRKRYFRIQCNRMFNDIYRYFGHNTNYSD